ncbi:phage minor tail protein L, partial [Morganella morganii]
LHAMCTWCIRGKYKSGDGCDYAGQNGYFDKHGNRVDDPAQDQCSGMLNTGCFHRFGKNNPIPFGGFPGTSLLRK